MALCFGTTPKLHCSTALCEARRKGVLINTQKGPKDLGERSVQVLWMPVSY